MKTISSYHPSSFEKEKPSLIYHFELPENLQNARPTENRGIRRDEVRLMISNIGSDHISHDIFYNIDQFLYKGDVLIVNTSGTIKAALEAYRSDGTLVRIHFSSRITDHKWLVEIRKPSVGNTNRFAESIAGEQLALKNGGSMELLEPYYKEHPQAHLQLWYANVNIPITVMEYLEYYGKPIQYKNIQENYPQSYYQTIFAKEMGSAEMPSAGRPFTPELVSRLVSKGVRIVPVLLHTGVASLEMDERPYEEYFSVSQKTTSIINMARKKGKRIIAVGTTVVRAIESVTDQKGQLHAGKGWTNLYITPKRGLFAIDGLLTGFHEPRASHLLMLEALAGRQHLEITYKEALQQEYLWHEFGDIHLILP